MARIGGLTRLAIAVALWVTAHAANAGLVTLVGNSINYVYDDSQTALALFGAPRIVGDAIRFLPGQFRSQSLNNAGTITADAEFIFSSVYSQDGSGLNGVNVSEFGDYRVINAGSAGAELELTVADNTFSQSASTGQSFTDSVDSVGLQLFELNAGLDLETAFSDPTNDINVTISNILTATSAGIGEGAWIQKKLAFAAVTSTGIPVEPRPPTEVVPAPGVLALFGAGLLALGGVRRRNRPV